MQKIMPVLQATTKATIIFGCSYCKTRSKKKNLNSSLPSDKQLSNFACSGQVFKDSLLFCFLVGRRLVWAFVRMKSYFPSRKIYLSRMTGQHSFQTLKTTEPHIRLTLTYQLVLLLLKKKSLILINDSDTVIKCFAQEQF